MKLLLYELVSAGGLGRDAAPSLRAEGWAMLSALVADFTEVSGVEVTTLLADDGPNLLGVCCQRTQPAHELADFQRAVGEVDAVLVIAPECGDLLACRNSIVVKAGKTLLGCQPAVVRLTGDKLALAQHWRGRGVPTPATCTVREPTDGVSFLRESPAILKPRHGAGAQATFLVNNLRELAACLTLGEEEAPGDDFVLQPFVKGLAASVTFLIGPGTRQALPGGQQLVEMAGRVHYRGGVMPLDESLARRAERLGVRALAGLDGLAGLVGVDLVLGEAMDGSQDVVIEINPRVTTSYLGLRQLCQGNLAHALWQACQGREVSLAWRRVRASFDVA